MMNSGGHVADAVKVASTGDNLGVHDIRAGQADQVETDFNNVQQGTATKVVAPVVELLPWEQQIVNEWVEEDSLVISASGLGWQRLIAVVLRLHYYQKGGCVLLLGLQPWQRDVISLELSRHDALVPSPVEINNEVPATERIELYKSGRALAITARILVVDLLTSRVTPGQIAGIMVLNAHRVSETSGEAFAMRLFVGGRNGGGSSTCTYSRGWIRALSDTPTAFTGGFNKVEKVMRALHVRRLSLWPRFRQEVLACMETRKPQVVEWEQELPQTMLLIQAAIVEVTEAMVKELKKSHKVDLSGLEVDQMTIRTIPDTLRRQLEPQWDTLSWRTRQIVKDLRTLKDVSTYLTSCDAVTFLAYLESLRLSAGPRTVWLFHDAVHTIYEQARRRVYIYNTGRLASNGGAASEPSGSAQEKAPRKRKPDNQKQQLPGLQPVLEEVPKWDLLCKVLQEVQKRRQALLAAVPGQPHPCPPADHATTDEHDDDLKHELDVQQRQPEASRQPQINPRPSGDVEVIDLLDSDCDEASKPVTRNAPDAPSATHSNKAPTHKAASSRQPAPGIILDAEGAAACVAAGSGCVVVVSRELHSSGQLESVVRQGGIAVMQAAYEAYLMRMKDAKDGKKISSAGAFRGGKGSGYNKGRGRRGGGRGGGSGVFDPTSDLLSGGAAAPAQMRPGEATALAQEAARLADAKQGVADDGTGPGGRRGKGFKRAKRDAPQASQPLPPDDLHLVTGGGQVDTGSAVGVQVPEKAKKQRKKKNVDSASLAGGGQQAPGVEGNRPTKKPLKRSSKKNATMPEGETPDKVDKHDMPPDLLLHGHQQTGATGAAARECVKSEECAVLKDVHFLSLDAHQAEAALWRLRPSTVIIYDPDLAFLRQVEVYCALHGSSELQVHLLAYTDSSEQAAFLAAVDKEITTFSSLIQFKDHIVIPVQPPPLPGNQLALAAPGADVGPDAWLDVYQQNSLTRLGNRAAAAAAKAQPRRLVIDMREFMSSLPAVLHQQGFELIPVTLEVGDYVLSPEICVERKAVPDLIASLASGRLYSQAEAMTKHYKTPILLIEFEGSKKFGLQNSADLGDDIDSKAVGSRLALLTIHFPKLRLVWSRSLQATADLFASLKSNQDEPDPNAAQLVGLSPEAQLVAGGVPLGRDPGFNTGAVELLKRLPGVTDTTARLIMGSVSCIAELATLPLSRLEAIMCSQRNAKLLHDFLHTACPKPQG